MYITYLKAEDGRWGTSNSIESTEQADSFRSLILSHGAPVSSGVFNDMDGVEHVGSNDMDWHDEGRAL